MSTPDRPAGVTLPGDLPQHVTGGASYRTTEQAPP